MNITHFSHVDILVQTVSSEDVLYLKTELLKSATFEKFKISFPIYTIDETLNTLIGEPYHSHSDWRKVWFFRMPHTDFYLHILMNLQEHHINDGRLTIKVIQFNRVHKEDTPFF